MLKVYCDETEYSADCRIVCLAGCMAAGEAWSLVEQQWQEALAGVQINELRARDLDNGTGEFYKWKDRPDERNALLAKLIAILRRHHIIYLLASEPVYKTAGGELLKDDPYFDCLVAILESVAHHVRTLDGPPHIEMVFTETTEQRSKARTILLQAKHVVGGLPFISDAYRLQRDIAPLQVADLVLFELWKERERLAFRRTHTQRWVLNELLKNAFYWNGYFRPPW